MAAAGRSAGMLILEIADKKERDSQEITCLDVDLVMTSMHDIVKRHAHDAQCDKAHDLGARPLLAVLLTFRHNAATLEGVKRLVAQLLMDPEARLMLVIATDTDDAAGRAYDYTALQTSTRIEEVLHIKKPPCNGPLPIWRIWNSCATEAFASGADWVRILLRGSSPPR